MARVTRRVRLDPIPDGSLGMRAYSQPVPVDCPLEDIDEEYEVVGVITIYGDYAIATLTKGRIPFAAWPDFDEQMRERGVTSVMWRRHRSGGRRKDVERSL